MLALTLAACGGDGGGAGNPAAPTPVPTALTLTVPATAQADASVNFASSAAAASGLRFAWDFGDGAVSSDASPSHMYAKAGDYDVKLTVSNEAGQAIEQRGRVSIERTAGLAGLDCTAANARGWCWLLPRPNGNLLGDLSFSDAQTGWIAGDNGEIWKTVDGGASWTALASGIHQSLRQVVFASAQRGWVLGAAAGKTTLWSTDNGGQSWLSLGSVPTAGSSDTHYSDSQLSWLGGEALQVYSATRPGKTLFEMLQRSTDGGRTWSSIDTNAGQASPGGILWRFEQRWPSGFGGFVAHGAVQRSQDGGLSWQTVLPLADATVSQILLAGDDTVLVVSWAQESIVPPELPRPQRFHLSRDRGATWVDYAAPTATASYGGVGGLSPAGVLWLRDGDSLYRSEDFGASWRAAAVPAGDVSLPARLELGAYWAVARSGAAQISFDQGLSWSPLAKPESGVTWGQLRQTGARRLLLQSTADRAVYASSDGGQSWQASLVPRPARAPVTAFQALDSQRWLRLDGTGLLRTADGGRNWQKVFDVPYAGVAQFSFVSSTTGWLYFDGAYRVTRDGGQSWAFFDRPGSGANLVFASEQHGWAFTVGDGAVSVRETKDGGASWAEVGRPPLTLGMQTAQALSDTELVVAGLDRLWLSTDAGKTWRETLKLDSGGFRALARAGARGVWAVGSGNQVWRSANGGADWQRVTVPGPADASWGAAFFLDTQRGWLDRGELLRTEDGGLTWTTQPTGSSMVVAGLQFIDAKTGWLWGEHGLLMTGSGGQ